MPDRPSELFDYGVRLDWLDDNRIAVIKTEGRMARAAIDTWADLTIRVIREWEAGQKLVIMFDLTGPDQSYSPYVAKRTIDVYRSAPPHLFGDIAIVLRQSIVVQLLTILAQREGRSLGGRATQRFFTDTDAALSWLRSRLETPPSSGQQSL